MMIGFSHSDAARAAIAHLFAQGHRRIGFVGARMDPRVQRRLDGYVSAMKDAALFDQRLVVTTATPTSVTLGGTLFADLLAQARRISTRCSAPMTTSRSASCSNAGAGRSRSPNRSRSSASTTSNSWPPRSPRSPACAPTATKWAGKAATMLIEAIDGRSPRAPGARSRLQGDRAAELVVAAFGRQACRIRRGRREQNDSVTKWPRTSIALVRE